MDQIPQQNDQLIVSPLAPERKPKSNLKLIILASVVGVIIIGGLAVWKFMPSSLAPAQPQPNPNQQSMQNPNTESERPRYYVPLITEWKPMTTLSRGQNISFDIVNFDPPFYARQVPDQDLNTKSPIQVSAAYYHLLADGKIDKASQLTLDPAKSTKTLTAYQARVGADVFKTNMTKFLTDAISITAIVKTKDAYLLIVKDDEYGIGVQIFQEANGKFSMVSDISKLPDDVSQVSSYFTDQNQ